MKKSILIFVLIMLLFSIQGVYGEGRDIFVSGDFRYIILSGDSIEIVGYTGTKEYLAIPEELDGYKVVSIGRDAMGGCAREISIPESVVNIEGNPFAGCYDAVRIHVAPDHPVYMVSNDALIDKGEKKLICYPKGLDLKTYNIPDGIRIIGEYAFSGSGLTKIVLPKSVEIIGNYAFSGCLGLNEISLPEKLTAICDAAFYNCYGLKEIEIPDSVEKIGINAFRTGSSIDISVSEKQSAFEMIDGVLFDKQEKKLIYYPDKLENKTYEIPQGIREIGEQAFFECGNLTEIILPDSLTKIGSNAFSWCSNLTEITIPDSVVFIGINPFSDCGNLKKINVSKDHPAFSVIDNALFDNMEKKLICYPAGAEEGEYAVPEGTVIIGDQAFYHCENIYEIMLPDSVTHIGNNAISGCNQILYITIPDSVIYIGDGALSGISYVSYIGEGGSD